MNNQRRQLIVGAVGFAVASSGLMLRFVIRHPSSYSFQAFIGSFGHERTGGWNTPSVGDASAVLSKIGISLFYTGLLLMVAALLAWLFTPQQDTHEDRAA
jgi:hypothetical protein